MDLETAGTGTAGSTARRAERADGGETETKTADWKRAHEELVRLARLRASLDWDEGRWLVSALRFGAHLRLGFGNFVEYVERLFGYRPRFTQEKLRVAEALEELPELERALREGELSWSVVRELTRVATRNTEKLWIEAARGRTVRDVEKLISGRKPGDRPDDKGTTGATWHTLRFEVSGEALATFREAPVPGCRHGQYLDVHHVNPRADGGDHNPENLIALCGVHHRAVHGGRLVITGSFTSGFRFRHADGTSYGTAPVPHACEAREKAFLGLRKLGFHETETRRALETALGQSGAEITTEGLLRRALAAFRPASGQVRPRPKP